MLVIYNIQGYKPPLSSKIIYCLDIRDKFIGRGFSQGMPYKFNKLASS